MQGRRHQVIDSAAPVAELLQLAAVNRALDRAGVAIIATGLKQCPSEANGADSLDPAAMEKLLLTPA